MSVFACLFHIKDQFTLSLSYTSKGKHSLYCADFSLSPYFIFPPSSLSPGRAHSYTHPGTSLEVLRPHTEQCKDLSLTLSFSPAFTLSLPLSFPLFYMVTLSLSFPLLCSPLSLFPHFTSSQASQTEAE